MSIAVTVLTCLLSFLVVVLVVTFVHELGHFLVARRLGVRVHAFAVGFGPELFGWTDRVGTRFKLCLLPLGGYVKMFGEQGFVRDESGTARRLTPAERAESYFHKSPAARAAIVFAGPAINIIFGLAVIAVVLFVLGTPVASPVVGTVDPAGAAAAAGLQPGDRILAVDDAAVANWPEIAERLTDRPAGTAILQVERSGRRVELVLAVAGDGDVGATSAGRVRRAIGAAEALWESARFTGKFLVGNLNGIAEIVVGERAIDELVGPVRIAAVTGDTLARLGPIALVMLMALLSINVGIVNLLPIPVLDGGHLVLLGAEQIRGRPLDPRLLRACSQVGLAVLLILFLVTTGNDLAWLTGLAG